MSKYMFYTDIEGVDDLKGRIDTIRDVTSGLLMSAPALSGLLSFLREYPDNKVISIKTAPELNTEYGRVIEIRHPRQRWAKMGRLAYPPIKTSIYVDNWAYDEYKRRKRKALNDLFYKKKDSSINELIKMFKTIRKLNPDLKKIEIIEKLNLSPELLNKIDKRYKLEEDEEIPL